MDRRSFLHDFSHLAAYGAFFPMLNHNLNFSATSLSNTTSPGKILVIIKMNGGNDGLNTVTPLNQYANLNIVRPHVIIPENKLVSLNKNDLALHPSLADLKILSDEKRMKVIQNVGYEQPDFSHFRSMDIWQSAAEMQRVSGAARNGTASLDDLSGSTFTITSLGRDGGLGATPIINHPEVSILGIHKAREMPVVKDGKIAIRRIMNVSSSFDHRIVDGANGAALVQTLKSNINFFEQKNFTIREEQDFIYQHQNSFVILLLANRNILDFCYSMKKLNQKLF